jgi:hypothetical protein
MMRMMSGMKNFRPEDLMKMMGGMNMGGNNGSAGGTG